MSGVIKMCRTMDINSFPHNRRHTSTEDMTDLIILTRSISTYKIKARVFYSRDRYRLANYGGLPSNMKVKIPYISVSLSEKKNPLKTMWISPDKHIVNRFIQEAIYPL